MKKVEFHPCPKCRNPRIVKLDFRADGRHGRARGGVCPKENGGCGHVHVVHVSADMDRREPEELWNMQPAYFEVHTFRPCPRCGSKEVSDTFKWPSGAQMDRESGQAYMNVTIKPISAGAFCGACGWQYLESPREFSIKEAARIWNGQPLFNPRPGFYVGGMVCEPLPCILRNEGEVVIPRRSKALGELFPEKSRPAPEPAKAKEGKEDLVKELRKRAKCVHLACEASVADDLAKYLHRAANEIDRLQGIVMEPAFPAVHELLSRYVKQGIDKIFPHAPGCQYAGPGRGDCEHAVGVPDMHGMSIESRKGVKDIDTFGKPIGWCWYCWLSYQLKERTEQLAKAEAHIEECHAAIGGYKDRCEEFLNRADRVAAAQKERVSLVQKVYRNSAVGRAISESDRTRQELREAKAELERVRERTGYLGVEILKRNIGFPRCDEQHPNGMDAVDAALAAIDELMNKLRESRADHHETIVRFIKERSRLHAEVARLHAQLKVSKTLRRMQGGPVDSQSEGTVAEEDVRVCEVWYGRQFPPSSHPASCTVVLSERAWAILNSDADASPQRMLQRTILAGLRGRPEEKPMPSGADLMNAGRAANAEQCRRKIESEAFIDELGAILNFCDPQKSRQQILVRIKELVELEAKAKDVEASAASFNISILGELQGQVQAKEERIQELTLKVTALTSELNSGAAKHNRVLSEKLSRGRLIDQLGEILYVPCPLDNGDALLERARALVEQGGLHDQHGEYPANGIAIVMQSDIDKDAPVCPLEFKSPTCGYQGPFCSCGKSFSDCSQRCNLAHWPVAPEAMPKLRKPDLTPGNCQGCVANSDTDPTKPGGENCGQCARNPKNRNRILGDCYQSAGEKPANPVDKGMDNV